MKFFSKNNKDDGFIINTDDTDNTKKVLGEQNLAPHAITPQEVSNLWVLSDTDYETDTKKSTDALASLKNRMNSQLNNNDNSTAKQQNDVQIKSEPQNSNVFIEPEKPTAAPLETKAESPAQRTEKTLLEKLKKYTVDEDGHNLSENHKPLYKLESVAEILLNDSENAIKNLSEKYGLDFIKDNSDKSEKSDIEKNFEILSEEKPNKADITSKDDTVSPTPAFEQMVSDAEKRETEQLYENLFPNEKEEEVFNISVPDISDIDTAEIGLKTEDNVSDTATIRFTPIKNNKGNTDHISISSMTKHIELDDDFKEMPQQNATSQMLEEADFDRFEPEYNITDSNSAKKAVRQFSIKKRSLFLSCVVSAFSVIALAVFLIPSIYDIIIKSPKSTMFICGALVLISVIANYSMFFDFKNLFKKRSNFDTLASLLSLSGIALSLTAAFTNSDAYYTLLLIDITLFIRAYCKFKEVSAHLGNLKQITDKNPKKAATLINDQSTTFAMTKNAIEGDVLAIGTRKTDFIEDYGKHISFLPKLSGKVSFIFFATLFISVLCGVLSFFYYKNIFDAVYCATAIICIANIPSMFFIDALPLCSAAKKLNAKGSMIAGIYGAEKIENSNAIVINVNDIFPSGTVSLYSMKVLSNNSIDETILKAAALTEALNSPLESIFKQIAGTNTSYKIPNSDTVKYEKRLGISGWVDDKLLFIGNRALMEAHGIDIPSIEVDKKILRKGYFPVYVATEDTACALLVIQYDVRKDIAKELRKITELGMVLLVENCDPNINEEMICDYFGLYEDSVKNMTNSGVHMYKNATADVKKCSAPAVYRGSGINLIKIVNCASNLKKSNKILTVLYTVFSVFGAAYFIYTAFSGLYSVPAQTSIFLYQLAVTFISIIGFLIRKP